MLKLTFPHILCMAKRLFKHAATICKKMSKRLSIRTRFIIGFRVRVLRVLIFSVSGFRNLKYLKNPGTKEVFFKLHQCFVQTRKETIFLKEEQIVENKKFSTYLLS